MAGDKLSVASFGEGSEAITKYRRVRHLFNKDAIAGCGSETNVTSWIFSTTKWECTKLILLPGSRI
jgi:hypothetical protein